MGLDLNETLKEVNNANDTGTLDRLQSFVGTGDQGQENQTAQAAITARRTQLAQQSAGTKMANEASSFRGQMPGLIDQQMSSMGDVARRSVAQEMSQDRAGYNKRGLLYSGLRMGANANTSANAAAGLQDARTALNNGYEQRARTMEGDAVAAASGGQQQSIQDQQMIYDQAMKNVMQRLNMIGSISGSAGSVAGAALGGNGK